MSDRRTILSARMWLLALFDAAERTGIAPLTVERLHRLVYLANAMAPVYDLLTPDGYILKYKRGPFFPAAQWDIDRLSAQGLVWATDVVSRQDALGWWFTAKYSLTHRGMDAVDIAMKLDEVARKAAFLREVVRAFAAIARETLLPDAADDALLGDIAFAHADANAPIDFRSASENLTALAAAAIARRAVGKSEIASRRAKVHLYFRYLERTFERQGLRASV